MSVRRFLPGVPGKEIERIYREAPGNEIESGKFDHPESSAALAANAFGYFLGRAAAFPRLPGCPEAGWPARSLALEATVRFPWSGGRHPVLDCLIATSVSLIGVESKRFEPFRAKRPASFSDAYWRPCWGNDMRGYESVRDRLREDGHLYRFLDAAQLVKHAFALRTESQRGSGRRRKRVPVLFYLYAEPRSWPKSGRPVRDEERARHWKEITDFAGAVSGDEVGFVSCSYQTLLDGWMRSGDIGIREHARAVQSHYAP